MPYESLDSLSRVHPQATVELAYTLYHLEPSQRIATAANRFTLPGGLECRWPSGRRELFFRIASECSAPLRLPGVLVARIESADSTCPPEQGEPPVPAGLSAKYIHYGSDTSLADFDPSPVRDSNLDFFDWSPPTPSARNPKELRHVEFCRGTPLTIRTGQYQSWFDLGPLGEAHQATIQYDPYRVLPDDKTPHLDPEEIPGRENSNQLPSVSSDLNTAAVSLSNNCTRIGLPERRGAPDRSSSVAWQCDGSQSPCRAAAPAGRAPANL